MQRLFLLGLNHKTAPLHVREKLAFTGEKSKLALVSLKEQFPSCEAVIVSTCNRVEMYMSREVHGYPRVEQIVDFLSAFHDLPVDDFKPHLYEKSDREMIEHLFSVVSSLDSMVLGETQILGQVRDAYDNAHELAATGSTLNPLFQKAIAVGKQVMHDTPLAEGRVSVASVAVGFATRVFDDFSDKTVLSIGAGKMSRLVLRAFANMHPGKLLVCNRDPAKAIKLAEEFGGQQVPFEKLTDHLAQADVVVSGTSATHAIITREMFDVVLKKRRYKPMFLIDIALPRDVEESVGKLENVYLYNLDDLQQVVSKAQSQRVDAVNAARTIVAAQVEEFLTSHRAREMGPLIDRLYKRYHQIAMEEVDRLSKKVPENDRPHLEELARRIVNKMLHNPVQALRNNKDGLHGSSAQYIHAMERLFALDDAEPKQPREDEK